MAMKPINRHEVFLEALAKGETANVKPVTREEMFIKKIAERESGGVSWDNVTDKPFGTVLAPDLFILSELTFTPEANDSWFSHKVNNPNGDFVEGTAYHVMWDGTEYVCDAQKDSTRSGWIGSREADDGVRPTYHPTENGEYPFYIVIEKTRYAGVEVAECYIHCCDGNSHTVEIYTVGIAYETLSENYIPETIARTSGVVAAPASAEVGQILVVKAVDENGKPAEWEPADNFSGSWNDLTDKPFGERVLYIQQPITVTSGGLYNGASPAVGQTCFVSIDGVEYEITRRADAEWGNAYIQDTTKENTGEPIYFRYGSYYFADGEKHTIAFYTKEAYAIDATYLPKAAAVADVTDAPTAENFNALLASLRAAGYLAE